LPIQTTEDVDEDMQLIIFHCLVMFLFWTCICVEMQYSPDQGTGALLCGPINLVLTGFYTVKGSSHCLVRAFVLHSHFK